MAEPTFTIVDRDGAVQMPEQEGIELANRAQALGRPVAIDLGERAAYLGVAAAERAAALASLDAPDFMLPDLAGQRHSLAQYRGRKVLLVAYASW